MIGISGIIWGLGSRLTVIGARSSYAHSQVDTKADDPNCDTKADIDRLARHDGGRTVGLMLSVDTFVQHFKHTTDAPTPEQERRAADMLKRGIARSRRNSNGEGFGE